MSKPRSRNKGTRNGHMKRFSSTMVNAGKTANTLVLGEYNARARTLATPLKEANYSNNEEHYRERRVCVLRPVDVVINKMKHLWTANFWQGYDIFNRIRLIDTRERALFLFFSGPRWFFVSECFDNGSWFIRRSIIYPDREIAMLRYYRASICWIEKKDVGKSLFEQV